MLNAIKSTRRWWTMMVAGLLTVACGGPLAPVMPHASVEAAVPAEPDVDDSSTGYEAALRIYGQRDDATLANQAWHSAMGFAQIGDVILEEADGSAALEEHRDALTQAQHLADEEPDNIAKQGGLYLAHYLVGSLEEAEGNPDAALQEYRAARAIFRPRSKKYASVS